MIKHRSGMVAGTMLFAATALCTVVVTQNANNPGGVAIAAGPTTPSPEVAELLPVLSEPPTADDKLPPFLTTGPQVLRDSVPASARSLGEDSGVRYWSVLNTEGDACLIALLPGSEQSAAMSCSSPAEMLDSGLGLQINDAQIAVRAFVVPDDFVPAAPGFEKVDRNLIVESADEPMEPTDLEPRRSAPSLDPIELIEFDAAPTIEN